MASSLKHKVHQYGTDSYLQRLGIWHIDTAQYQPSKYWIIYIHGGVWRDPRITYESFIPTIDQLLSSSPDKVKCSVAAFASVDYRLGPHPHFPQDPETTPPMEYRNAFHPDHINDVWFSLRFLQSKYGFGGNYVLVGHSAGAMLALQLLMGSAAVDGAVVPSDVKLPTAIVGLEGIYDLNGIAGRFGPDYANLFVGAFGDSSKWNAVSPMKFRGGFKSKWEAGKLAVLGWSPEDELIDMAEVDGMAEALEKDGVKTVVVKDLMGTHDGMWEDGGPFARIILKTLEALGL